MTRAVTLVVFFMLVHLFAYSQRLPVSEGLDMPELVEGVFAAQEGDMSFDELYEQFLLARSHPSDLNSMTSGELSALHILTDRQVAALLQHRERHGNIVSVYELQGVEGFTPNLIRLLNQVITVDDGTSFGWKGLPVRMAAMPEGYLVTRMEGMIQRRFGFRENEGGYTIYRGAPFRQVTRFRSTHNRDFSYGFTAERDAGERFRWNPADRSYGPDFLSGHLQLKEKGWLNNLIVGDFVATFGQGLVAGGGFSTGKGAETITTVRRPASGFMPYTSVGESGFFRGLAATISCSDELRLHLFGSRFFRDGDVRIRSDSVEYLGSVFSSGYHRTPGELLRRKSWLEENTGLAVQWTGRRTEAGVVLARQWFSVPLLPADNVYNRFNFRGKGNGTGSVFLNHTYRNVSFFSEFAYGNRDLAWIAGFLAALAPSFDLALVARNYGAGYHAFYSTALAENTRTANEQGLYAGVRYKPGRRHQFAAYHDQFRFPWLRFRSYLPSCGNEFLFRYTWAFTRGSSFHVQYRAERKSVNVPGDASAYYRTTEFVRRNWALQLDYRLTEQLKGRIRLQGAAHSVAGRQPQGIFAAHDLFLDGRRWRASFRYALFDIPDSEARQFTYERDIWMAYSFPSFSGTGIRSFVNVQFNLSPKADLWFRWAVTNYSDRDAVGFGPEQTEGGRRDEWKVQLRIKL